MELTRGEKRLLERVRQQKQGRRSRGYSTVLAFCHVSAACWVILFLGTDVFRDDLPPGLRVAMLILAGIFLVAGTQEFFSARFRKNALSLIAKLDSEPEPPQAPK